MLCGLNVVKIGSIEFQTSRHDDFGKMLTRHVPLTPALPPGVPGAREQENCRGAQLLYM